MAYWDAMRSVQFVALLRGINVGGRNIIKMTDLVGCFEGIGCMNVASFIQSGNILFRSDETDPARLLSRIERVLSGRFGYAARAVVMTDKDLTAVVQLRPAEFGEQPDVYKYDVIFLREPLSAAEAMKSFRVKEGIDTVHKGEGVLYTSRLISKLSESHLSKLVSLPVYQHMTVRNWNTTTKLLALMKAASPLKSPMEKSRF
jgi:uncharacterized protein (DUF1697 family)